MFKILAKNKITPIYVAPGDIITVIYKEIGEDEIELLTTEINEYNIFNTAIAVSFEDELNLSKGLLGGIGKEKDE